MMEKIKNNNINDNNNNDKLVVGNTVSVKRVYVCQKEKHKKGKIKYVCYRWVQVS